MEFELSEVDNLHDAVEDATIELSLNAIDWFEDVEATYYSDESEDWETSEGEELTESENREEDSDLDSIPALQDVSDSDTEYGYESDSNDSDEGSTPYLEETQFLTHQRFIYPDYSDSSEPCLADKKLMSDYPTCFDSAPFSLIPDRVKDELAETTAQNSVIKDNDDEPDPLEWLFHSPKWEDRSMEFQKHLVADQNWEYIEQVRNGTYLESPFHLTKAEKMSDLTARRQVYIHRHLNHTLFGWENDPLQ
ncbi:hypothetical protein GYMLUDRAFT_65441 [Collybiopsis luxurians FD-317 M1]|uniref:Uncharacterized protein n=1 Tax=Collybiopsis luxurians FD-317 M1 TaxID=944289 RepID=A0A0D0C5Q5_9AGAR|nr:hypothetical protein GYMLUDRAFT_65441 [Collybiopsis luxurians FD-317 M1]